MDFQEFVGGRIDFWERRRSKQKMTAKDLIEASYFGLIQEAEKFWKSEFESVKADCSSERSFDFAHDDILDEDFETQFARSGLNYSVEKIESQRTCDFCCKVKTNAQDFWLEIQWNPLIEVCNARDGVVIEICIDERDSQKDINRAVIGFVEHEDEKFLVKFCDHVFRDFEEILEKINTAKRTN